MACLTVNTFGSHSSRLAAGNSLAAVLALADTVLIILGSLFSGSDAVRS